MARDPIFASPGPVPGARANMHQGEQDVDGRDKPGHDGKKR
jgi:hypothetical protein